MSSPLAYKLSQFIDQLQVLVQTIMPKITEKLTKLQTQLDRAGILKFTKILKKQHKGAQICLVGGSARDAMLGTQDSKDYDFVVRGVRREDLLNVLKNLGGVDLVGKKFGVYKFKPANLKIKLSEPLDIALPRTEISTLGGGYRDFQIKTDENLSIEDDLSRRDFTINAMAWDLFDKKLIDPFNGKNDLSHKHIETVGNAYERFAEDYSRMLRGIRFACQLRFKIDDITWKAMCELMGHINDTKTQKSQNHKITKSQKKSHYSTIEQLNNRAIKYSKSKITRLPDYQITDRIVPYEVISTELLKAFMANPVHAFDLYDKSGAFKQLMPEILPMKGCPQPEEYHTEGDVWQHTRLTLKMLESRIFKGYLKKVQDKSINSNLVLACLLHDMGKPHAIQTPEKDSTNRIRFNGHNLEGASLAKKICRRLKIQAPARIGADPEHVAWLVRNHMLLLSGDVNKMRVTTLEKYFFTHEYPGDDLIKLAVADALATVPSTGDPELGGIDKLFARLDKLTKLNKEKNRLPKSLLNGDEIMKLLKIRPGKKVGELLIKLREEQLNGRAKNKVEAKRFLKNL